MSETQCTQLNSLFLAGSFSGPENTNYDYSHSNYIQKYQSGI